MYAVYLLILIDAASRRTHQEKHELCKVNCGCSNYHAAPDTRTGLHQRVSYACASTTIIIMEPCFEEREEKGRFSDILCNAFARPIGTTHKLVLFAVSNLRNATVDCLFY